MHGLRIAFTTFFRKITNLYFSTLEPAFSFANPNRISAIVSNSYSIPKLPNIFFSIFCNNCKFFLLTAANDITLYIIKKYYFLFWYKQFIYI